MHCVKLASIQRSAAPSYLYVIVHDATGIGKVRVLGVDVGQLYGNQVMNLSK